MEKQQQSYGCGMYAVANACNLKSYCNEDRLAASKEHGNTIGQLAKWMQEDGLPYYIEVLYRNDYSNKLPKSYWSYVPKGEDVTFLPVLIACQLKKDGLMHMVGGKIDKFGTLYLYDSLKSDVIETSLEHINNTYFRVYGLYVFCEIDTGNYCFI